MKCFERGNISCSSALSISSVHQATRSYVALRQEVGLLGHLHHDNVLGLRGVTLQPLSMLLAWAPHGSLDGRLEEFSAALKERLPASARVHGLPPPVVLQIVQQVSGFCGD